MIRSISKTASAHRSFRQASCHYDGSRVDNNSLQSLHTYRQQQVYADMGQYYHNKRVHRSAGVLYVVYGP